MVVYLALVSFQVYPMFKELGTKENNVSESL